MNPPPVSETPPPGSAADADMLLPVDDSNPTHHARQFLDSPREASFTDMIRQLLDQYERDGRRKPLQLDTRRTILRTWH